MLSIRVRLTALFVTIFGLTLIAFSALLYRQFVRNHEYEFDAALFNHAIDVSQSIDFDLFGDVSVRSNVLSDGGRIFPFSVGRSFLQIRSPDGKVLARSRTLENFALPLDGADFTELARHGLSYRTLRSGTITPRTNAAHSPYRLLSYLVKSGPAPRYILQIAVPMTFLQQESRNLRWFIIIGVPLTLILATFGGLYLSGRAMSPVTAITEKARGLSATNLSERIPVPSVNDEFRRLSLTLNALLDRLQQAFESQERFVADASHQLKTPLAIMRGELDVLKSRPRSPSELTEFIQSASQELGYLSRMVEDLLVLARVDAGAGSLSIQNIRLDEVALEAVSRLRGFAESKDVQVRFDLSGDAFEIKGDPDLLQSMLQSLLENAIKFSPKGGTVQVAVTDEGDAVQASVRDQGPGIPKEALPHIFERFYRAARESNRTSGVGLGLAIAKRIIDAHNGALEVQSAEGAGTTFVSRIKKS